ncbi:hypothetical protein N9H35_00165 [bacterium]|nr:hypothetical protein [bacterium]
MSEKRGHLEKMRYDFPTEAVLEVKIKENWYRVTSREFRSFDGNRRYSKPERQPGLGMKDMKDIKFITVDCNHLPLYMFGTNIEVEREWNEKIVNSPYYENANKVSGSRG